MESLLVSAGVVALAEIGDKTQLLAFVLAARFKRAAPIVAGILLATLVNHALAGVLGAWITSVVHPHVLRWVLGASFIAMGAWAIVPDRIGVHEKHAANRLGVFGTTALMFFIAEMGDKTQIATVALSARYSATLIVVVGTTLGMMVANVPAVFAGDKLAHRVPLRLVRATAAVLFIALGIATLASGVASAER